MTDQLGTVTDQLGCKWSLEFKAGAVWARGMDDDGKPCVRQVFDGQIVVDWAKPNAFRQLSLPGVSMVIDRRPAGPSGSHTP